LEVEIRPDGVRGDQHHPVVWMTLSSLERAGTRRKPEEM
jgi:hypothetical protein